MSDYQNQPNFTKALLLFCVIVFIFALVAENNNALESILRYSTIIGVILLLIFYYKTLDDRILKKGEEALPDKKNKDHIPDDKSSISESLFIELQKLIFSTVKAINSDFETAIYLINPSSKVFEIQLNQDLNFPSTVNPNNLIIVNLLREKGKTAFHQKDYQVAWEELFGNKTWRGSECLLGSKINYSGSTIGFVITRINHFSDITDKDKSVIEELGRLASYGLKNLDFLDSQINSLNGKQRVLDLLSELSFKSQESEALDHFKNLIKIFFKFDSFTISTKLDTGQNCIVKLAEGFNTEIKVGDEFNVNGTVHGLPIVNGKVINSRNCKKDYPNLGRFATGANEDLLFGATLGVPIKIAGKNIGSIILERISSDAFNKQDQEYLILIGNVIGMALHWIREYDKIYQDATHDGLSSLLNHQTFKERFNEEILRAERFQQCMTVIMFDLDKFKRVNDTLGHQFGDYVIKTVSGILKENVRVIDLVARYGGEEFVVILINTAAKNAMPVGKRIVQNISDYLFSMDNQDVRMTISAGMSEFPTQNRSVDQLIDLADQAMYKVKKQGGNNILLFNSESGTVDKI